MADRGGPAFGGAETVTIKVPLPASGYGHTNAVSLTVTSAIEPPQRGPAPTNLISGQVNSLRLVDVRYDEVDEVSVLVVEDA